MTHFRVAMILSTIIFFKLLLGMLVPQEVSAQTGMIDYFVATNGNDSNPGSKAAPFATWERARKAAETAKSAVTVWFRQGTYRPAATIELLADRSGSKNKFVTYRNYPGEKVIISGAQKLDGLKWEKWKDGVYRAKLGNMQDFDQIYINGVRQIRARFPNYDQAHPLRDEGSSYQKVAGGTNRRYDKWLQYNPAQFSKKHWSNPSTGIVHAFQSVNWGNMQYRLKDLDRDSNYIILGEGGWQLQRIYGIGKGRGHASPFFVENIAEELDTVGEWFYDKTEKWLYYFPQNAASLLNATVEVVTLKELIRIIGDRNRPVTHITLQGLTFTQTRTTFLEKYEPLARGDWSIHRGGAIMMTGAEDCRVIDCDFQYLGGNGIFMSNYNRRNSVNGCRFFHTGESAICMVGNPSAVRLYLTWDDKDLKGKSWTEMSRNMDLEPGPKNSDYPEDCSVENCLAYELGDWGKQIAGVLISMSRKIKVSHCTIYNVPRAAICINDGTWGGHIIEHCDIWEAVRETGEHGPFNSWGRERQWNTIEGKHMIKAYALLDAVDPVIIRHNRISNFRKSVSAGNWTIDLDDGSTNYHIYNNLSLGSTIKLRDGYYRKVWNNIQVGPVPLGWHVWPPDSEDEFYNNITVIAGTVPGQNNPTNEFIKPVLMPDKGGKKIDNNLYYNVNMPSGGLMTPEMTYKEWEMAGYDSHSVFANPLFVDPAKGNYQVRSGSPALQLGFQNFAMDDFGHQMTRIQPYGGEFEKEHEIVIKPDRRGGTVHYTLDGSLPTSRSMIYKSPFRLKETATVRAQTFKNGKPVGFDIQARFHKVKTVSYPSWYRKLLAGAAVSNNIPAVGKIQKMDWEGATFQNIEGQDMIDAMGGYETGIFLEKITTDGTAYQQGLRQGDILMLWNNKKIGSLADFKQQLGTKSIPNEMISITIIRKYQQKVLNINWSAEK